MLARPTWTRRPRSLGASQRSPRSPGKSTTLGRVFCLVCDLGIHRTRWTVLSEAHRLLISRVAVRILCHLTVLTWLGIFPRIIAHLSLLRRLLLSLHFCLLVVVVAWHFGLVGCLHCVVHVVVWILWEGMTTFVVSVCRGHLGMVHGIRVWDTVRGKAQEQRPRVRVL